MSTQEHKQKIWDIINDIKVAMMVSEDLHGDLHARPMRIVQDHYDGTLWFFTKASGGKVDEIHYDRRVCLTFSDPGTHYHVSLSGKARLVRDRNLIEKFWNPVVGAWFPEGKDSPECALLEIKIHKGEHWESKTNSISFLYEITKANLTDREPDLGESQKFGT